MFDVRVKVLKKEKHVFALCIRGKDPHGQPREVKIKISTKVKMPNFMKRGGPA